MGKASRRAVCRAKTDRGARAHWAPVDHELHALLERRFGDQLTADERAAAIDGWQQLLGTLRGEMVTVIRSAPRDWTVDQLDQFIADTLGAAA